MFRRAPRIDIEKVFKEIEELAEWIAKEELLVIRWRTTGKVPVEWKGGCYECSIAKEDPWCEKHMPSWWMMTKFEDQRLQSQMNMLAAGEAVMPQAPLGGNYHGGPQQHQAQAQLHALQSQAVGLNAFGLGGAQAGHFGGSRLYPSRSYKKRR